MRVLGVSPLHDSSAAIINDGEIEAFYKEERLTKHKRDAEPFVSVEKILAEAKGPIDLAVIGAPAPDHPALLTWLFYLQKKTGLKQIIDLSRNHHLQHASLAFYNSGFSDAAVIVIDRSGSIYAEKIRESETIFKASYPCRFDEVYKNYWFDSYDVEVHRWIQKAIERNPTSEHQCKSMYGIVSVYETATTLIKEHVLENGKTMGLASYGRPVDNPPQLFIKDNIPNDLLFDREYVPGAWNAVNRNLHKHAQENVNKQNYQFFADYAYQVQQQTQEAVCHLIQKAIDKTGLKKICITGGYGLNIVANHYYTTKFPDVEFYFEPLADDSGNSLGGAMFVYRNESQDSKIRKIEHTFIHGTHHSLDGITGTDCTVDQVAKLIANNNSVGVFNGLAESGPRALGNRSILFNPCNPNAKDIVNKIKNREWYRPFAAMVLEEDAPTYFDMGHIVSCPFMTMSFPVNDEMKDVIPGVVHADNTCRIQTVTKKDGHIYELLSAMKNITGHGILLNTSFNLAGKPLIEEPQEAIEVLSTSHLNYVWFPEIKKLCN
jgi:carbamoyltransferase